MSNLLLDIVPYLPWHLQTLKPGQHDVDSFYLLQSKPEWKGFAVSLRYEDRTLAVIAVARLLDKLMVGVVASDELRASPRTCVEVAKASLPNLVRNGGNVRVEIEVDEDFPASRRFAEWLGFRDMPNGNMSYEPS
jgi:hypothetical protein